MCGRAGQRGTSLSVRAALRACLCTLRQRDRPSVVLLPAGCRSNQPQWWSSLLLTEPLQASTLTVMGNMISVLLHSLLGTPSLDGVRSCAWIVRLVLPLPAAAHHDALFHVVATEQATGARVEQRRNSGANGAEASTPTLPCAGGHARHL